MMQTDEGPLRAKMLIHALPQNMPQSLRFRSIWIEGTNIEDRRERGKKKTISRRVGSFYLGFENEIPTAQWRRQRRLRRTQNHDETVSNQMNLYTNCTLNQFSICTVFENSHTFLERLYETLGITLDF
jgi:hypothetical protein